MELSHAACYRALRTRDARFDGRLFVGVETTGIYCRPICPARTPRREHVTFFRSAAAAQDAGFRPCLRCRPESAPDFAAWRGTSNTVSRALSLIDEGALDEGDVDALASRLGVGERQLRRLFRLHLGASPVAVAQTRRVLLAKQLIHDTRLPMSEVALASGFGSIRRFNETFQRLFGRPPGALRRSGPANAPTADHVTLQLSYRTPFDWEAMLTFLAARAVPGVERVEAGRYTRAVEVGDAQGVVSIQPRGRGTLEATIRLSSLTALSSVVARVRRVFDLAADPRAIASHLAEDERLAPLVSARPGLRVPGAWDGFELAVRAVLGQQITVGSAARLAARLVETCGRRLPATLTGSAGITHLFPAAADVAGGDLSALPMPRARVAAIAGLATAVLADPRLFDPRSDLENATAQLRALPGVGEWTAQYIAMRAMREPDAFPAADVGLLRAMAERAGVPMTASRLLRESEAWRPWRAYAAQHLWASLPTPRRRETTG